MEAVMSRDEAFSRLVALDGEVSEVNERHAFTWLDAKLPPEISSRLKKLWAYTKKVGGVVIKIGRIFLTKIIQFVKDHINIVAGAGVGVLLGAAIASWVSAIPLIGGWLGSVIMTWGPVATALLSMKDGILPGLSDLLVDFFKMIFGIFTALKDELFA